MKNDSRKLQRLEYLPSFEPSVQDVLDAAQRLKKHHGATYKDITVVCDTGGYETEWYLEVDTPETDEEYTERLAREAELQQGQREKDLEAFNQLKAKLGL